MRNRIIAGSMFLLAFMLIIVSCVLALTPFGQHLMVTTGMVAPTPTPTPTRIPVTPTPIPTPPPVLTAQGPAPTLDAQAVYLVDMDTGNVLDDVNGEKPQAMASTTKIMTALIAIQSADLDQLVPIGQDAVNRVTIDGGSTADYLKVGDRIPLRDLLYGLMVPSGDDAAVAIADALGGGSRENFVQRMNLFAYHLRLFQTHYDNPDGLNLADDQNHYSTAHDLARLAQYALNVPLFAQIVQTPEYDEPATAEHAAYTWKTTNHLLAKYSGIIGVKTGHTDAAGWCLVFAATRGNHHLLGVILHSPSEQQRDADATKLLDWGFALPLLPPG